MTEPTLVEFITYLQETDQWSEYLDNLVLNFESDTGRIKNEED